MAQQKEEVRTEQPTMQAKEASTSPLMTSRGSREIESTRARVAPLSAFRRFMDDMDRLFSGFGFGSPSIPSIGGIGALDLFGGGWSPAIETLERGDRVVFRADLPGLTSDDVEVEIVDDELVVSGERKQEQEETKGGRYYSERRYGSFERRILLPEGVDPESVEANFDNGVLEISVAVPERAKPRSKKISVRKGGVEQSMQEEAAKDTGTKSIH